MLNCSTSSLPDIANGNKRVIDRLVIDKGSSKLVTTKPSATKPVASIATKPDSRVTKSLSAFKTFATKFGAKTSRIKSFTDDKTSDDTHDSKVAIGIKYLQSTEKAVLEGLKGDASFTLDLARGIASQTKSKHNVFKSVNVIKNGLGFNYQFIASETIITAIYPAKVTAHLESLKANPIASLEELKKIEPTVDQRYVTDFEIRETAGLNKLGFRAYIAGRASRKLGKSGETDSIALYNKATGRSVTKNNTLFIAKDRAGNEKGRAIPDFFTPGVVVGDVKDVKRQSNDDQMKTIALIARGQGIFKENGDAVDTGGSIAFDLVVRKSTVVSEPLRIAITASDGGEVRPILEDKND